ncbi:hypothetical protein BCR44DRAFT_1439535 [Catenaria anguillulae PL171]|uniref:E3 ubiquitin protein ligase n=1 Tax=Catenaria anguillulae PL171 TaxID=765915 RepID=A0A1Y2HDX7_9FUNG|nr:hypothetical protein BCR44DRAFT_1439535 [Catenaria anguillulae PL171]
MASERKRRIIHDDDDDDDSNLSGSSSAPMDGVTFTSTSAAEPPQNALPPLPNASSSSASASALSASAPPPSKRKRIATGGTTPPIHTAGGRRTTTPPLSAGSSTGASSYSSSSDQHHALPPPPLPDAAAGERIPFPAESQEALESLIHTFQKDAVIRQLADYMRQVQVLQAEREQWMARNSQLSDMVTAIGGWWTEIADELLLLSSRFDAQQHINAILAQQDTARNAFLTSLLNIDQEAALEEQLNATHMQARHLVASFIHYLDHQSTPAAPDVDALRQRCAKLRADLVRTERDLAVARVTAHDTRVQLEAAREEGRKKDRVIDRLQSRTWAGAFLQPMAAPAKGGDDGGETPKVGHGQGGASTVSTPTSAPVQLLPDATSAVAPVPPAATTTGQVDLDSAKLLTLDDLATLAESTSAAHMHAMADELARTKRELDTLRIAAQQPPDIPATHPGLVALQTELATRAAEASTCRARAEALAGELAQVKEQQTAWMSAHAEQLAGAQAQCELEAKRLADEIARVRRQRDEAVQQRDGLVAEKRARSGEGEAGEVKRQVVEKRLEMAEARVRRLVAGMAEGWGWVQFAGEVGAGVEVGEVVGKLEDKIRQLEAGGLVAAADSDNEMADVATLRAQLANAQAQVAALCEEMDSTAEGYGQLDARISQVAQAIRARDDLVAKLAADKTKLDGKILFLRKQCEQLKADADVARRAAEVLRDAVRAAEDRDRAAATHVAAVAREAALAQERAMREVGRAADLEAQVAGLDLRAKTADEQVAHLSAILDQRTADGEAAKALLAAAEGKVAAMTAVVAERDSLVAEHGKRVAQAQAAAAQAQAQAKAAAASASSAVGGPRGPMPVSESGMVGVGDEDLLQNYRQLLQCGVCQHRFKDTVLVKCMHTFCRGCIDLRIETRQRKCPTCGDAFGSGDVKQLFL